MNPKHLVVLEFDEQFIGPKLRTERWFPHYLPQWSSRIRSAARYSLPSQGLQLHITEDQVPWNPAFDGDLRVSNLQTGCFSGPLGSARGQHHFKAGLQVTEVQPPLQLYTPLYGYFEVRLKAVPNPGYMVALWMIGFEQTPEQSAELCICEIFGQDVTENSLRVGYGLHPFGDATIRKEFYQEDFPLDPGVFHTYGVMWTPEYCEFYINDRPTRRLLQSPNYPMQLMLSLYELPHQLPQEGRIGPWPITMDVGFVRGYRLA